MKSILQIIFLFAILPDSLSSVLEKRWDKGADGRNALCNHINILNERVDQKILEFIEEVEEMRTGCVCAFDAMIDEKLAVLKKDLANVKNGCVCAPKCQDGWAQFQESCFLLETDALSWSAAEEKCKTFGGHLAEVDSSSKHQFLLDLVAEHNHGGDVWIGASDTDKEGQWKWSGSGKPLDFDKWKAGEPNGGVGENCAHLYAVHGLDWNDRSCLSSVSYICEKI